MKKFYIAHSSGYDYKSELCDVLKLSDLYNQVEFILPHDKSDKLFNSKEFFNNDCAAVIAEVSYPSTGIGIELGWADKENIPIFAFYKKGMKPSSAIKAVTNNIIEYKDSQDLIIKIGECL